MFARSKVSSLCTLNVLSRKTNKSLKKGRNKNIVQETWLRESFYNRTSSKPTQENFASNICVKVPKSFQYVLWCMIQYRVWFVWTFLGDFSYFNLKICNFFTWVGVDHSVHVSPGCSCERFKLTFLGFLWVFKGIKSGFLNINSKQMHLLPPLIAA